MCSSGAIERLVNVWVGGRRVVFEIWDVKCLCRGGCGCLEGVVKLWAPTTHMGGRKCVVG